MIGELGFELAAYGFALHGSPGVRDGAISTRIGRLRLDLCLDSFACVQPCNRRPRQYQPGRFSTVAAVVRNVSGDRRHGVAARMARSTDRATRSGLAASARDAWHRRSPSYFGNVNGTVA